MSRKKIMVEGVNYPVSQHFIDWLDEGDGRAAYFSKIDKALSPPMVSKMKHGNFPITLEHAIRLERAQRASLNPFRAIDIMTFQEHRELYLYVLGKSPAPAQLKLTRGQTGPRGVRQVAAAT